MKSNIHYRILQAIDFIQSTIFHKVPDPLPIRLKHIRSIVLDKRRHAMLPQQRFCAPAELVDVAWGGDGREDGLEAYFGQRNDITVMSIIIIFYLDNYIFATTTLPYNHIPQPL